MPELHREAVHAFWDKYDRRVLYRVIAMLENKEAWCLDHEPLIAKAIDTLGNCLDTSHQVEFKGKEALLIKILANFRAGVAIRILHALDGMQPGLAAQVINYAESAAEDRSGKVGDRFAKLFLRRNTVFERLQLLTRIFSNQRLGILVKAMVLWRSTYGL
jgi:intracellular multiplication protein IcmW